jgi:hypothetical protein
MMSANGNERVSNTTQTGLRIHEHATEGECFYSGYERDMLTV